MSIVVLLLVVIVLLIAGGAIIGLTLSLLGIVLAGLVIGALARLVLPGPQSLGILMTILYGIGGSLLGGILGDVFDLGSLLRFLLAVAVAALLITLVENRRGGRPAMR
jgi:uncharacterized membrane protein YeaQ/YmgE (transglycosylase-associated protein family)